MEIDDDLDAEQAFVGGRIDVYAVTDCLDLVFNEEEPVDRLGARVAVLGEGDNIKERDVLTIICGDCFICRHDGKGNFESITESDILTIRHYVKEVMDIGHGIVIID